MLHTRRERATPSRLGDVQSRESFAGRVWDCVLVLLLLPVALPVALVVAVCVWLDSPGPVLYRSRRIGKHGVPFSMLKFRTMAHESVGPPVSAHGDERYTPFGRTLAYSRLDELPQLFNVLRGDMRLVGPRPELEDFVCDFPDEYAVILRVPPGLTGPAQLEYAWEGEVLAQAQMVDRARLYRESILPLKLVIDMRYAERHSLRNDMAILARTLLLPAVRAWRRCAAAFARRPARLAAAGGAAALAIMVVLLVMEGASPV